MDDWGFKSQTASMQDNVQAWVSKRLFILIACALLVIIGGYLCASYFGTSPEPEVAAGISASSQTAARSDVTQVANVKKQEAPVNMGQGAVSSRGDMFSGPITLRGIIRDSRGSVALIEAGDEKYVAYPGMEVEDQWVVKEIKPDEVILESQTEKLRLRFHGRAQLETLAGEAEGDRD